VSPNPAITRVVSLLEDAGYRRFADPLLVADIPFSFSATLARPTSLDLVVVIDRIEESDAQRMRERIEGLGRALDAARSRRPLTVVLVGPRPELRVFHALREVARVLPVDEGPGATAPETLLDALGALLPLKFTAESQQNDYSWKAVRDELLATHKGDDVTALMEASQSGTGEVETVLASLLSAPLEGAR
jgi:hypothetical protein